MLVMVYGKKRVKGNTGKNVYYTEGYQVDGNLYWSDDNFYRCKAPSPLESDHTYNLTDVQVWYPLRNCWIRCNWFTNLKCFGYDMEDLYSRLKELERWRREEIDPWKTMIQRWKDEVVDPTLQDHGSRISTLESWRRETVDPFILNMSQWRSNVVEPHMQEINRWRSQDVDPFIVSTNDWRNNVVNPTLSDHGSRIGTLEGWRTNVIEPYIDGLNTWRRSVGDTLQNHETRISANATNINTIFNRLTTMVQDFDNYKDDVTTEMNKIIDRVNRNGTRGFQNNGANGYINAEILIEVVNWCNSQGASITSPIGQIWSTKYNDPLPNIV